MRNCLRTYGRRTSLSGIIQYYLKRMTKVTQSFSVVSPDFCEKLRNGVMLIHIGTYLLLYMCLISNGFLPENGINYSVPTNKGFNRVLRGNMCQEANTPIISKFFCISDRSTESQLSCTIHKLTKVSDCTIPLSIRCNTFMVFSLKLNIKRCFFIPSRTQLIFVE